MANILFYTPFNRRARDVESLILGFRTKGHTVISLSQQDGKEFNLQLIKYGVEANSYVVPKEGSLRYYFKHLWYFINFCRKKEIEIVFSHLDPANFVASIGQYFVKAKVFLCKHHINEAELYNYDSSFAYRIANILAKQIIVVSKASLDHMAEKEGIPQKKLIHINLGYDFKLFEPPRADKVAAIRESYRSKILLVSVCRLTKFKRPDLSIKIVNELNKLGLRCHLIMLGDGEMRNELNSLIRSMGLQEDVSLPGHVTNVLEFLAAADFVVHPSVLESSCVVIKEAGLVKSTVIVCRGVGDFDDYIVNGFNGYLVDKDYFVLEVLRIISSYHHNKEIQQLVGVNLYTSIIRIFDIKNILAKYQFLIDDKAKGQ